MNLGNFDILTVDTPLPSFHLMVWRGMNRAI